MPYIPAGRRHVALVLAALVCALLVPAAANAARGRQWLQAAADPAGVSSSSCTDPTLTQPFLSFGDQGYYTLVPGESPSNFSGDGWTLLRGANITSTSLADGTTGDVLDLPGGSVAVSPPMCVTSDYATARMMIRSVQGLGNVHVFVAYPGTWFKDGGEANPQGSDWGLSDPVQVLPSSSPGWQIVRFVLLSTPGAEEQLYDFYVDPYQKG